jgi:predicted permease
MGSLYKIRQLIARKRFRQEIDEEISLHIELATRELIDQGVPPAEAARRANLRFGGRDSVAERTHAVAIFSLENLLLDLRFALRMLMKNRVLTAVVILSMAIGIGANVSIFTVMNAVMFRAVPVREPENLVFLSSVLKSDLLPEKYVHDYEGSSQPIANGSMQIAYSLSTPTFEAINGQNTVFDQTFAFAANADYVNVGLGTRAESAQVQAVSGGFFNGLGVTPDRGRVLNLHDDAANSIPVAVISHRFWMNQLGGSVEAIGKMVTINETRVEIVGVAPQGFYGLDPSVSPDFWIPLSLYREQWARNSPDFILDESNSIDSKFTWWLVVVGRLKPNVSMQKASAELSVLFAQNIGATSMNDPTVPSLRLLEAGRGLHELRQRFATPLALLMGMVVVVLLIACANVAALLLARSTARRREVATRLSLGAPRARVIRQLMTESVLLSLLGGVLGFLLSGWMTQFLVSLLDRRYDQIGILIHPDTHVLLFTVLLSVGCGLLFGWAPAMHATRVTIVSELRQQTSSSQLSGRHRFRPGKILVGAQVALCVLLLVTAGLLVRTLRTLQSQDLGFKKDSVTTFTVRPGINGYKEAEVLEYYRQLQQRLSVLPGVRSVTYAQFGPVGEGRSSSYVYIPGYNTMEKRAQYSRAIVGSLYFDTLGIPIIRGRTLGAQDTTAAKHVIAVNQAFVKTYLHGDDPIGMQLVLGDKRHPNMCEVVGVIRNVKYGSVRDDVPPTIYMPLDQMSYVPGQASYMLLADASQNTLFDEVNHAALALNPNVPVVRFRSEATVVKQNLFLEQTFASLSSAFAGVGLLLACIGLYGTIAYTVAQRTSEIGIRMALGAARETITRMILGETLRIVIGGILVGIPTTLIVTRLLRSQLYHLSPYDTATLVAAVISLAAVSIVSALLPARKASKIDPLAALRHE